MIGSLLMQTEQIVALLVAERDRLNRAIEALQGPIKRRGRPPKSAVAAMAAAPAAAKGKRKRRSAAQRKAQSEKMKAYWANRKKQKSKA
jgi:hypothetical protein